MFEFQPIIATLQNKSDMWYSLEHKSDLPKGFKSLLVYFSTNVDTRTAEAEMKCKEGQPFFVLL